MAYLSIWALYQDEAPYMREWIEFHRLMGVERFFLYDHDSVDDHRRQLAPYIDEGVVTLYDWPIDPGQVQAANHCLEHHRDESRWIAFLDLDEFLFSPTGRPLPEVLADYEQWPGVVVNWATFGTSGHPVPPPGLVIENYLSRSDNPGINGNKKSIVDPSRVLRNRGGVFDFSEGSSVDENMQPADGRVSENVSFERLRINHYHTKSKLEFERKVAKPRADRRGVRDTSRRLRDKITGGLNEVRDETLLPYAGAVREALERTRQAETAAAGGGEDGLAVDPQAIYFARDVLMGVALCAQDGTPYPHPDLAQKAAAMLVGRPAPDDEADTTA
jgi:glycosyl transferase family 92